MFQFPAFAPCHRHGDGIAPAGLPHSDIRGCCGYLPLTAAFRSLSRPSSPPRAKASPMRPCQLRFIFRGSNQQIKSLSLKSKVHVRLLSIPSGCVSLFRRDFPDGARLCSRFVSSPFPVSATEGVGRSQDSSIVIVLVFKVSRTPRKGTVRKCSAFGVVRGRVELPTSTLSV